MTRLAAPAPSIPVGTGPARNATFLDFPLGDRLEAKVNAGSGNLLIRSADLSLPGISEDLTLGAAYNSLLVGSGVPNGSLGVGWRVRSGVDVRLIKADDGSLTYLAADGVAGLFTPAGTGYTAPGEFKATLVKEGSGWKLTEHQSGRKLHFTAAGILDKVVDRNNNATDFSYDTIGRQTSAVSTRGVTGARTVSVVYNAAARISAYVQQTESSGRSIQYGYDGANRLTSITSLAGKVTKFEYDASNRVAAIVNAVDQRYTVTYDSQHRVTSVTKVTEASSGKGATTRLAYPSSTQTQVADANTDLSKPVADVPHTTYTVDGNERVTKSVDPAGKTRSKTYTPFQDIATSTDATSGQTVNSYGANGGQSLTKSAAATGASAAIAYGNPPTEANPTANFQPSTLTDTQGNQSVYTYNGPGNKTSTKDANAADAKVDYNTNGTIKTATDPANGSNATKYSYDADAQLKTITPPTGNSLAARTFSYDEFGRVKTVTDGEGRGSTYDYNRDGRLLRVSYSDDTPAVELSFDAAGRLTSRTDVTGETKFRYNPRGELISRTAASGGGALTYIYDPVGNLKTLTDGRGTTTYDYDTRNLLTALTDGAGKRYTFRYDDEGRRTETKFDVNADASIWAARTTVTFDKSGRLTRTTTARKSNASDVVFDVSYCYAKNAAGQACSTNASDDTGIRQWQTDHVANKVSVYTYDKGDRLTKATEVHGKTYEYGYDSNGNRKTVKIDGAQTQNLTFNSANQLTTAGETYDKAGHQTGSNFVPGDLTYNASGQTTAINNQPNAYAGTNQVEATRIAGTTYVYGLNSEHGQPWAQSFTGTGGTGYVERDGAGTPLGLNLNGQDHYYVLDGLGTVVAILDANGDTAATYTYDPYGAVLTGTGPVAAANPIRYTGGLHDANSGLTKLGERWYNPTLGRFTQQDSIERFADPREGNRYAYAADNPTNNIDPTGMFSWSELAYHSARDAVIGAAAGCVASLAGGCGPGFAAGLVGGAVFGAAENALDQGSGY